LYAGYVAEMNVHKCQLISWRMSASVQMDVLRQGVTRDEAFLSHQFSSEVFRVGADLNISMHSFLCRKHVLPLFEGDVFEIVLLVPFFVPHNCIIPLSKKLSSTQHLVVTSALQRSLQSICMTAVVGHGSNLHTSRR
jgi:hypothetical protein